MFSNDTFLDLRPPKSPKWFFTSFKNNPPPLPQNASAVRLGSGAQIVRTPAEALSNVPTTPRISHKTSLGELSTPDALPLLRHQLSVDLKHKSLKVDPRRKEHFSMLPPRVDRFIDPTTPTFGHFRPSRVTLDAIPPFTATLMSKTNNPCPTADSHTFVRLDFGYSLERPPRNDSVIIPWDDLAPAGGYLIRFVASNLDEIPKPDLTDGSSDNDSDYNLDALLRDEYLQSMYIASPAQLEFPAPPIRTAGKKRAATRNQYTQMRPFPSPLSPLTSLGVRRNAPRLNVEDCDGGGRITTLVVLLARDASSYHILACRLATGRWPKLDTARRQRLDEELRWLGMLDMTRELADIAQQSMVKRGGVGYI